jgi:nitroreductase
MAVCPRDALQLDTVDRSRLVAIDPTIAPRPEQVEQMMRARRSVRLYRDTTVPQDQVKRIIDTANMSPSGMNRHPIRWTVISGRDAVHTLSQHIIDWMKWAIDNDPQTAAFLDFATMVRNWPKHEPLRGAPQVVVAHGAKADPMTPGSGTIALTYFELAAAAHGVGTCWAGFLHMAARGYQPLIEALKIPGQDQVAGALMLGFPRVRFRYVPARPEPQIRWG